MRVSQIVMQQFLEAPGFIAQPWYWDVAPNVHTDNSSKKGFQGKKRVLNLRKIRELVPSLVRVTSAVAFIHAFVRRVHACA